MQKGRVFEDPVLGKHVHLDLRHLGAARLHERLPLICEMAETFLGIDPATQPIPVRPAVHYTMGGIATDNKCETTLRGLYAIGECSNVGLHGANRLGSNSLTELLVFGKLAGDEAVKTAKSVSFGNTDSLLKQAEAVEKRVSVFKTQTGGKERIANIRKEMTQTMEDGCGIYRMQDTMQQTCDKLAELRERFKNIELDDKSSVWNTDWLAAIELDYQLDVAQSIAHSAIQRKESRGAHQRLDGYEQRDDVNFLKHSDAFYVPGSAPRIAYAEVKITKSPPAARVYGAAGEKADAERKASNV
jgi:fumarate reductase flavoprotein subunit